MNESFIRDYCLLLYENHLGTWNSFTTYQLYKPWHTWELIMNQQTGACRKMVTFKNWKYFKWRACLKMVHKLCIGLFGFEWRHQEDICLLAGNAASLDLVIDLAKIGSEKQNLQTDSVCCKTLFVVCCKAYSVHISWENASSFSC